MVLCPSRPLANKRPVEPAKKRDIFVNYHTPVGSELSGHLPAPSQWRSAQNVFRGKASPLHEFPGLGCSCPRQLGWRCAANCSFNVVGCHVCIPVMSSMLIVYYFWPTLQPLLTPKPNISIEFFQALGHVSKCRPMSRGHQDHCTYASVSSSIVTPFTAAMTWATRAIVTGSFRPFTMSPSSHFSFLTAFTESSGAPSRYFDEA